MPLFTLGDRARSMCIGAVSVFCLLLTLFTTAHAESASVAHRTGVNNGLALAAQATQQARGCPEAIRASSHWNDLVGAQAGTSHVEHILCGRLLGDTTQQALVTVRHNGASSLLDVYVYTALHERHPLLLFSAKALVKGDATISRYDTVLTGEADRQAMINEGKADGQLTQDLYREFRWSHAQKRFIQVAFPGMFPDMTRYQAEIDQQKIAHGLDLWKRNATDVALAAARQFFAWKRTTTAAIISGGRAGDLAASVRVTQAPTSSGTISEAAVTMQLNRLEGKHGAIWEVAAITSSGALTLTAPLGGRQIASPVTLRGHGPSPLGVVGMAFILDHLGLEIGHANAVASGKGDIFQAHVTYASTVSNPVHEEGIAAVFSLNTQDGSISTATMEKVLL